MKTNSDLIFDASIRKWRKRTPADDKWTKDVINAVKALEGVNVKK